MKSLLITLTQPFSEEHGGLIRQIVQQLEHVETVNEIKYEADCPGIPAYFFVYFKDGEHAQTLITAMQKIRGVASVEVPPVRTCIT